MNQAAAPQTPATLAAVPAVRMRPVARSRQPADSVATWVTRTRRAGHLFATRQIGPKAAIRELASVIYADNGGRFRSNKTPVNQDLLDARQQLLGALLAEAEQVRVAAAARGLLMITNLEPEPPPVATSEVLAYVHHAWLRGHSELTSPTRRARLATNRWVRSHPGAGPAALADARAQVRATIPQWERELDQAASKIPSGLFELELSAPGVRLTGNVWPQSSSRHVLLHALLEQAFAGALATGTSRGPWVIRERSGGTFRLVLPAVWAHWLAGPTLNFTARPGRPVATDQTEAHALALRYWNGGTGPSYQDALLVAESVLAPSPAGGIDEPAAEPTRAREP